MECPVCYDDCHKTCNLVCGHSMCMSCVKQWWVRSEGSPTCPICRSNLYFRGMRKVVGGWVDEIEEPPEHDEEDWDRMCSYLLVMKQLLQLSYIRLVEPPAGQDFVSTLIIYNEFPSTWFPPPRHTTIRPRAPRGVRGRRSNWLEE